MKVFIRFEQCFQPIFKLTECMYRIERKKVLSDKTKNSINIFMGMSSWQSSKNEFPADTLLDKMFAMVKKPSDNHQRNDNNIYSSQ
jgi:hypothetical protein